MVFLVVTAIDFKLSRPLLGEQHSQFIMETGDFDGVLIEVIHAGDRRAVFVADDKSWGHINQVNLLEILKRVLDLFINGDKNLESLGKAYDVACYLVALEKLIAVFDFLAVLMVEG